MQGNKKQTDGQSDSSSIGSLLDDTDREVCSLTDRAFKSLCVAELETSFPESDPVLSSNIPHHFSSKFFHGPQNYVVRENTDSNKRLSKTEERSTFQQFPKDAQEDKQASINNAPNIRRKLGLPVSGLRSHKHTSKVSSLIKTFDKAEKQPSLEVAKQPVKNSLTEGPLVLRGNMALWGGKAILNLQKELSGFSGTCQDMVNASSGHGICKRHSKMDLVCQGPYSFYFSQADTSKSCISPVSRKTAKNRIGKAKEPTRRGNFLHSENSAFESWNAHHKKLTEVGDLAEIRPKGRHLTYFEEAPFLQQPSVSERKLLSQKFKAPQILKQDVSDDFSQISETCLSPATLTHPLNTTLSEVTDVDSQISVPHASDLPVSLTSNAPFPPALNPHAITSPVSIPKAPISPPPPQASVPPRGTSHGPNPQTLVPEVTVFPDKANLSEFNPGLENVRPPWRKQKTTPVGTGLAQDIATGVIKRGDSSYTKPSDLIPLVGRTTVDLPVALSDPSSSNFNISKLLTPVIPHKQEKEPLEDPLLLINPALSVVGAARESEERASYCSQNNYKSKAPSLLFNLKDIRKRVKSTYSPSPLLRALEDKKKIKELDNMKANVRAVNMAEEGSEKLLNNDERSHQPYDQIESIQEEENATNLNGNYLTWNAPKSKADAQHYQNRHSLWQGDSVDVGDSEMVSVIDLHQDENNGSHYSPSSNCYFADMTTDQELYVHHLHMQSPKHGKNDLNQNFDVEPQVSPNLFFTTEENKMNNEKQACSGNEHKGKRSTSSSEHSFVSIIDQPYQNEAPCSLMHLFQKACLQESQRKKNDMSGEGQLSSKETEKIEGKNEFEDDLLNDCASNTEVKYEKTEEKSENDHGVQGRVVKDKEEDGWKGIDSASEDKLEEPLSPTSSNSFKPNLFMIKDNTFKSSPVIKAVKLPLRRSVSCEDTTTVSHSETEKPVFGPVRATPNLQEMELSTSRTGSQQNASSVATETEVGESGSIPVNVSSQVAKKGNQAAEDTLTEGQRSFYGQELVDERASITSMLSEKDLEGSEKLTKAKETVRTGKPKMISATQPNLGLESDLGQNNQTSPTREKTSHFKNDVFSKRRGGSCIKKIISQEMGSIMISESQTSPVSSDAFGHVSATSGNLPCSALPSPMSDSMRPSAFTSPLSDTTATSNVSPAEKTANSSLLHRVTESRNDPSAVETTNPVETSQPSGDASNSPMSSGRQQLMGRMVKTAAKPPAVPPKTEKALRRAKKLASKRKKIEAQQKKPQGESLPPCTDITHSQLVQSPLSYPVCPKSPLMPSESNLRLKHRPSLSPTPSLPETQRKLLQDPDSGEYFIIDLPLQLKTFYDPETGRYLQVSIPPSQRNLSRISSSEMPPSAFVLYPSTLPLRVSSVPVLSSPSQFSEPASFAQGTHSTSEWQPGYQYPHPQDGQPGIKSAVSDGYSQEADETECSFEKDVSLSANADIISTGAIEDFAVEGIL